MENPTYVALSRQIVLQRKLDITANNLANVNTTAFKRENLLFKEFLGSDQPTKNPVSMVVDDVLVTDPSTGPISDTGNPLDLAINGKGYLKVETPVGVRYTRNGHLTTNAEGLIVTPDGFPVLDADDQPIPVPLNTAVIEIRKDGSVSTDGIEAGRVALVDFEDERKLVKTADGIYKTEQLAEPVENPQILQHALESSNVEAVTEITAMIKIMRAYEATSKMVEGEHERIQRAIRELPRVDA